MARLTLSGKRSDVCKAELGFQAYGGPTHSLLKYGTFGITIDANATPGGKSRIYRLQFDRKETVAALDWIATHYVMVKGVSSSLAFDKRSIPEKLRELADFIEHENTSKKEN